jgi:hypothetical protein
MVARVSDLTVGEKDTGLDFVAGDIIESVWINVRTLEATAATKTIDVGLLSSESGGDADGFLDGVSTATPAGIRTPSLASAGQTLGTLLHDDESGAGVLVPIPCGHVIGAATSLTYTLGSAHTELVAEIHVKYFRPQA